MVLYVKHHNIVASGVLNCSVVSNDIKNLSDFVTYNDVSERKDPTNETYLLESKYKKDDLEKWLKSRKSSTLLNNKP